MANHKQALKRHRQSLKRNLRNKHFKSLMKSTIKKALARAEQAGDEAEKRAALAMAESMIQHVAHKGVIPRRRADRAVSRLARRMLG